VIRLPEKYMLKPLTHLSGILDHVIDQHTPTVLLAIANRHMIKITQYVTENKDMFDHMLHINAWRHVNTCQLIQRV